MKNFILLLIFFLLKFALVFGQEQAEENFIYNDKGRRNPFFPLVDENGKYLSESELSYSYGELKLSGILWDSQGKSSALINNQIVKIGESICGYIIKDITKDGVTVFKDGKDYIITMSEKEKK